MRTRTQDPTLQKSESWDDDGHGTIYPVFAGLTCAALVSVQTYTNLSLSLYLSLSLSPRFAHCMAAPTAHNDVVLGAGFGEIACLGICEYPRFYSIYVWFSSIDSKRTDNISSRLSYRSRTAGVKVWFQSLASDEEEGMSHLVKKKASVWV
ncbi:hypothetical protein T440DRAFT_142273 [Plenodomus tracheiphilus IPT5]|uniref:Uncharacterized protein n=1 Tax=Plenodomus tracheiphilus IPT5 TaxID=1408161 RepID=A0A6A7B084_9PLEO|nr:hypothetical protein T440DRAFT_142273 [Plenodomus tracheiphilus IPT5]